MDIDIKKLEGFLEAKDVSGARNMISEVVSKPLTNSEKGATLVSLAEVYMDVMNSINDQYKAVLEEAIKGMELIKKAESATNDKIKITEVKESLKS